MSVLGFLDLITGHDKILGAISSVLAVLIYIGIGMSVYERVTKPPPKLQSQSFENQLKTLNDTENNLKQLIKFVEMQKGNIADTEKTMQSLKSEHEKLMPLIKADRNVVEALLAVQDERNYSRIWVERGISFVLGILASLLASVVYSLVTRYLSRKTN